MQAPIAMGPTKGFDLETIDVTVIAGAAFSQGDVVAMTPVATGIWTTARVPVAQDLITGICGVCLTDIASGDEGIIRLQGPCQAFILSSGGATATVLGAPLVLATTKDLDVDAIAAAPKKYFAIDLEATSASATRAKKLVLFSGITGFGTVWLS